MISTLQILSVCAAGIVGAVAMADNEMTVLTLNVRVDVPGDAPHTWEARRPLIADFITELRPDLIGLQEALKHQLDGIVADHPEYGSIGVGREDGGEAGEYTAILYLKERYDPAGNGTFWLSDTPEAIGSRTWGNHYTRICTWGRFFIKSTGNAFYFFNTHFDHESQTARDNSAELILARISSRPHPEDPVILTGDFNAGETNPAIARLSREIVETFRLIKPEAEDVGTFHGFSGVCAPEKIDTIFVDGPVTTLGATIHRPRPGGRYLTDHEPVSAQLILGSSNASETGS